MDEEDRRRRRGLIGFQVFIYGIILTMFLIQLQMYFAKGW